MKIILLSGGSGTRLWPLSNDARSKQFLKLLPVPGSDAKESMFQRVVRQIQQSGLDADLTVATAASQRDSVVAQIGDAADLVLEPSRRNTFPAICLACEYLAKEKHVNSDEVIVVMPCDPFTGPGYFDAIGMMGAAVEIGLADLLVMGIRPTYPSAKYGYILPGGEPFGSDSESVIPVKTFVEKPSVERAEELIRDGALWNGGVFAFRLGYLLDIARRFVDASDFEAVKARYEAFPKISFDYEVAEKASSIAMVPYEGEWKDLGTWNTLTDELPDTVYGNVTTDDTVVDTHIINELDLPLLCIGTRGLLVAASPDGIIVTEKSKSENVKHYAERLKSRPMYEERRWGEYRVIDHRKFEDGFESLTKYLRLNPGSSISYQRHAHRDETWTFVDGRGELILDGERREVGRGETVFIARGRRHALRALTPLSFIEVQTGSPLIEEDIERLTLPTE